MQGPTGPPYELHTEADCHLDLAFPADTKRSVPPKHKRCYSTARPGVGQKHPQVPGSPEQLTKGQAGALAGSQGEHEGPPLGMATTGSEDNLCSKTQVTRLMLGGP